MERALRPPAPRPWALTALLAALVGLPYATLSLPLRTAQHVQAGGILLALALAGGLALRHRRRLDLADLAAPIRSGLALWTALAVLGGAIGLAAGNPRGFLAGQFLSLALLPIGAFVGTLLMPPHGWLVTARSLVGLGALAATGHLLHWLVSLCQGRLVRRLFLDNAVSLGSLSLLCLLLALALVLGGRASGSGALRYRLLAALLTVYLIGTGIRGLWLLAPPCIALFLLLRRRGRWAPRPARPALVGLGAAALALLLLAAAHQALSRSRPDLLPPLPAPVHWRGEAAPGQIVQPVAVPGRGSYRFSAQVSGGEDGLGQISVRWLDDWGDWLGGISVWADPAALPRWLSIVDTAPAGTVYAEVVVSGREQARGTWTLAGTRLERLDSGLPPLLVTQAAYFDQRLTAIARLFSPGGSHGDNSFSIRFAENRALLARFRNASWPRKLFGHGLGATFSAGPGAAPLLSEGAAREQSYIHNFYLFLLFKLGLAGGAAALAALGLWTLAAARAAWQAERPLHRAVLAAAASAWVGYCVLAVTSPELINFRFAPVLGVLLAAAGSAGKPD